MTRVVFDTNVFISALLKRNGVCGLRLNFWRDERFVVLYSQELILEIKDVVNYPRLRQRFKRREIGALIRLLRFRGERVRNNRNSVNSSDPKDDFLIAITQQGIADFLVSRDIEGILKLNLEWVQVMKPEDFLRFLRLEDQRKNTFYSDKE